MKPSRFCDAARDLGMASYLDGARLFNAAAASRRAFAALASPFDPVSVALSKGLGCPVGGVTACLRQDISRAVRARRMFGGAMRQSGIVAAAGLWLRGGQRGDFAARGIGCDRNFVATAPGETQNYPNGPGILGMSG
jgi:hypothetical protein